MTNKDTYVSVETGLNPQGYSVTVYLHTDDDVVVLAEFWETWHEVAVDPKEPIDETFHSDLYRADEY